MKSYLYAVIMFLFAFCGLSSQRAFAQQQPKQPDLIQLAEEEADKLQKLLDLEDWQVFYVDSTLKANYILLQTEYEALQKSKVTNSTIYRDAHDRCLDKIEEAYKKFFTEKQWALYLKNGAAKAQKQRAKRREQAPAK